jgi:hypothetical protein
MKYLFTSLFFFTILYSSSAIPDSYAATTWQQTAGPYGGLVHGLAIAPSNPQTVYAWANNDRIFKSSNGGANWSHTGNDLPYPRNIQYLAVDPSNPQTVYAATYSGILKSIDGGTS